YRGAMRTDRGWRRFYAIGWSVSAIIGAAAVHQWHGRMRAVEEKLAEAERTREAIAQRVAAEERLRIARELHDSLTHSISVIKVQAGVAAHLARKRGEEVPGALLAIQEASGAAARELRSTLEVLRAPGGEDAPPAGGRVGLARLDELVGRARVSGLPVAVAVRGEPAGLPPAVDRAAFRIVQEALTNAVRHAGGGASASVLLEYRADGLGVLVEDDGRASPDAPPEPGTGLIGMRERVASIGGELSAGPGPGGGFRISAELP